MATPLEQLDAMHGVPENWDGYGGLRPAPEAIAAARTFYLSVAALPGLPETYLTPTPNGGVHLEWQLGPQHLEVGFEPGRGGLDVEFLFIDGRTGESIEGKARGPAENPAVPASVRRIVTGFAAAAA